MRSIETRFESHEGLVPLSQCGRCERFTEYDACRAYPRGIPAAILSDTHDHTAPYEGDGGLLFEARPLPTRPKKTKRKRIQGKLAARKAKG
jgi:hypothetical protein